MHTPSLFTETVLRHGAVLVVVRHFFATGYALAHNAIPIITEVEAWNLSDSHPSRELTLSVRADTVAQGGDDADGPDSGGPDAIEIASPDSVTIPRLSPGQLTVLPERGLLRPHPPAVRARTEGGPARFRLELTGDPEVDAPAVSDDALAEAEERLGRRVPPDPTRVAEPPFRVLAENEWFNHPAFFESVVAFAQPNSERVREVLSAASRLLAERTGDSSLQGYQAGPDRAARIGLALYEALRARSVAYINPPASFENTGQRIRSTDEVLTHGFGTCIDLSLCYAAVCEAAGLHPVIILVEGHALTGLMLREERSPHPVVYEPGHIRNLVTSHQLLPLDAVFYGPDSFADAVRRGRDYVTGAPLRGLVDVFASRHDGMRPLPGGDTAPVTSVETSTADGVPALASAAGVTSAPRTAAPGSQKKDAWRLPDLGDENTEIERAVQDDDSPERVRNWKASLLDLTLRNRLLSVRPNAEVLRLELPTDGLALLDDLIHDGTPIHLYGKDALSENRRLQGATSIADLPTEQVYDDLDTSRRVYADVTEASYRRRMLALARSVKTLYEETGSGNLYLALGTMEIFTDPARPRPAPLFLVPVRISGGKGRARFTIVADATELATPNYCLTEWLRVRHNAEIPSLSEPPIGESGLDIDRALADISQSLTSLELPYTVREDAYVGIFKFSTYGMWRDLETHWREFRRSPVFMHLVDKAGTTFVDPVSRTDLRDIDVPEAELTLPIAADGAQMRAVVAASGARSFVLEGPPGTGKSQTIANLIAQCLLEGRTMLFVAEKQAALEVVQRRLERVGLSGFTLDLHGVQQSATNIRRQLKASIEMQVDYDERIWRTVCDRLRARLAPLREYPGKVHDLNGAGHSLWTAVELLDQCGPGTAYEVPARAVNDDAFDQHDLDDALHEFERLARSGSQTIDPTWELVGPGAAHATEDELLRVIHRMDAALSALIPAVRADLEAAGTGLGRDDKPAAYLTPLIEHLEDLHRHGEVPAEHLDAGPSRERSDALSALAADVSSFQQRLAPLRSAVTDDALITGDFQSLAVLAEGIEAKLFGRKKRRLQFEEHLAGLVHEGVTVPPETAPALSADAERARQEMHHLDGRLNAALAGTRIFGCISLQADVPEKLLAEARAQQEVAESIEAQAAFAATYPHLRELVAEHALGYEHIPVIREFEEAWTDVTTVLDVDSRRLGRWTGDTPWVRTLAESLPVWEDDVRSDVGAGVRRVASLRRSLDALTRLGMHDAVEGLLHGRYEPVETTIALRRGIARASIAERTAAAGFDTFDPVLRDGEVEEYQRAAEYLRAEAPTGLAARVLDRRPFSATRLTGDVADFGRQLTTTRGQLPFRRLMERFGSVVTSVTPCLLVSPASLAKFVPPDGELFDLVVFDEASQVPVEQAVGALGRARSAVVVGDSQQMPPTRFGQTSRGDSESFEIDEEPDLDVVPDDLESILTECVESGFPRLWLTWHYRSQDERLIAFSNNRYYENGLSSLPSPGGAPDAGILNRRVDGFFYRTVPKDDDPDGPRYAWGITPRPRTNPVEAETIVDEIVRRVNDPALAHQSIGVVTFNIQQRDLILDALESCPDPVVQARLVQEIDPLVVKNLENVQGDERDVILFSTAFSAREPGGRLPLNFGPLGYAGGERRLNVAITRARRQVVVVTSFDASDIDLDRTQSRGLADLRGYLESASVAPDDEHAEILGKGPIRDEIAARLTAHGLEVSREYGLSEFRVDLSVRQPGSERWQCAVLLDSPRWAAMPTVADREVTPGLLSSLMGWGEVVRVWLPAWQVDPDRVIESIIRGVDTAAEKLAARDAELKEARAAQAARLTEERRGTPDHTEQADEDSGAQDMGVGVQWEEPEEALPADPAREAVLADASDSPDAREPLLADLLATRATGVTRRSTPPVPVPRLGDRGDLEDPGDDLRQAIRLQLSDVIAAVAPMTTEELGRRLGACFGLQKVRSGVRDVLLRDLPEELVHSTHGERFVWPPQVAPRDYTGYRSDLDRPFADIPLEEIANAMAVATGGRTMTTDERYRATIAVFGLKRLTEGTRRRCAGAAALVLDDGDGNSA